MFRQYLPCRNFTSSPNSSNQDLSQAIGSAEATRAARVQRRLWAGGLLAICVLAVCMLNVAAGYAEVISGSEPPDKFGNLKQGDTDCPNTACGPTAAINSFVFLQNMYSTVYGTKLVPHKDGNTMYQDEVDAANKLAPYMGCCQDQGTYREKFILGKQQYLEEMAKGKTVYAAEDTGAWRKDYGDKPDYVQDNTAPTAQFLVDQLKKGADIELFIDFLDKDNEHQQHYVTLTSLSFDTETNKGKINFVDPETGKVADNPYDITGLDSDDKDILIGGYLKSASIYMAVSEAPVPEPGTLLLLGSSIVVIGNFLRKSS